jgi:large subunit ribosomal protein L29
LKINEFRALSSEELTKQLKAANQEFFDIRLKAITKQLVNHREIPRARKKIARIQTLLREKELGAQ